MQVIRPKLVFGLRQDSWRIRRFSRNVRRRLRINRIKIWPVDLSSDPMCTTWAPTQSAPFEREFFLSELKAQRVHSDATRGLTRRRGVKQMGSAGNPIKVNPGIGHRRVVARCNTLF